jgi:hypothetical protein
MNIHDRSERCNAIPAGFPSSRGLAFFNEPATSMEA